MEIENKIIIVDGEYSYDFKCYQSDEGFENSNLEHYELWYSNMELWTEPNTLILKLIDDGSLSIKIQPKLDENVDVDLLMELGILIRLYHERNFMPEKIEIYGKELTIIDKIDNEK